MTQDDFWSKFEDEDLELKPSLEDFVRNSVDSPTNRMHTAAELIAEIFSCAKSMSFDQILAIWDEFNFCITNLLGQRRKTCEASNPDLRVGETELPTWGEVDFVETCKTFSKNPDDGKPVLESVKQVLHTLPVTDSFGNPRLNASAFSNEEVIVQQDLPVETIFSQLQEFTELFGDLVTGFRQILRTMKRSVDGNGQILSNDWYIARDVRLFRKFIEQLNKHLFNILRGAPRAENALSPNSRKDCCPDCQDNRSKGRRRRQRKISHVISDQHDTDVKHDFRHETENHSLSVFNRCRSPPENSGESNMIEHLRDIRLRREKPKGPDAYAAKIRKLEAEHTYYRNLENGDGINDTTEPKN